MLTSVSARLAAITVAAFLLAYCPPLTARDFEIYTVSNMQLDETAESAAAAREIALSKGQAQAFQELIDRIVPKTEHSRLPEPTAAVLLKILSGIEVENEKTSSVRYIADLTVRFNRAAVRRFLREAGVSFAEAIGDPLVVLPVYRAIGTVQLWDEANLWLLSWQSLPSLDGLLPLIVPEGDSEDIAVISPEQALNGDERRLRAIANRYRAIGSVLAVATLRRDLRLNSAVLEVTLSRIGSPDGDTTSVMSFTAAPTMTTEELLDMAAGRIRDEIVEAWKQDHLIRFGERREMIAVVPLSGLAAWIELRKRIASVASVEKADLLSLALDEASVRISYYGGEKQLALAFAEQDMELNQGAATWQLRILARNQERPTEPVSQP